MVARSQSPVIVAPAPPRAGVTRLRTALVAAASAIGASLLVALVFLVRAGSAGTANWPVHWELGNSDNGVLFQLLQDVAAGRTLDWSFSPQVYIFPELPVSAVAYVLGAGDVYRYYLLVAMINGGLMFLAVFLLVSVLFRADGLRTRLIRAGLAFAPLVLLPLVGGAWLPAYHLAPTYYFGMYLMLFAAPAFFFVRGTVARVLLGAGLALTTASNPLVLVFCGLPFTIVLVVLVVRRGFRSVIRPALAAAAVLVVAAVVRFVVFAPLQGVSPFSYVDSNRLSGRLTELGSYLERELADLATLVIFGAGAVLAVGTYVSALLLATRIGRRRVEAGHSALATVYLGLVPVLGLACTLVLTITSHLYLWPVLVAPFIVGMLPLPVRWQPRALVAAAAAFVLVLVATGGVSALATPGNYFGYRSAETRCLDEQLPPGAIGYATYTDARRLSLPSATGLRLVPLASGLSFRAWLVNLDYRKQFAGSFFYLNAAGEEPELDRSRIVELFGTPDEQLKCGETVEIWRYTDPATLGLIASHFANEQILR